MRQRCVRLLVVLLAIAMGTALGACERATPGASASHVSSQTAGACSTSTAGGAAIQSGRAVARAAPQALPVTTLPPGVTVGQVRVVVESGEYDRGSTIFAWAGNGLSQCIDATDHQSACSIIVLERQVGGAWQPQANCLSASPTRTIVLPPMQAAFLRLVPPATGAQPGIWQSGTYRVAFTYRLGEASLGQSIEVDSGPFTIS